MSRFVFAFAILGASFVAAPHAVAASPGTGLLALAFVGDGDEDAGKADKSQVRTKDAGSIEGEVVSVDYRTSHFSVKAGPTTYDVVVLPSTDFQGRNNSFRGITDIKKGAHVNVMLSQRAATFVAQIIHLH
jgi:hypothetical protein